MVMISYLVFAIFFIYPVRGDCPDPGNVDTDSGTGHREIDGLTVGSIVSYYCNTGYRLNKGDGVYVMECQSSGVWNGTSPFCEKIDCGQPRNVINSQKSGDQYSYNDEVTFTCEYGFRLPTNARELTIICTESSEWDEDLTFMECSKVKCPALASVPNANVPQGTFYFGDTILYPCLAGYTRYEGTDFVCLENGQWDGTYPRCELADCGDPGEPTKSVRNFLTGTRYADTVTYSCMEGYSPYPEGYYRPPQFTRSCQSDGRWSGPDPQCLGAYCGEPGSLKNMTYSNTTWRYPESVIFACDVGFVPLLVDNQNEELTCSQTGSWDYGIMSCERETCSDVGETEGTDIDLTIYRYTDVKTYRCMGGFVPERGDMARVCQANRTFSGDPPVCKRVGCPEPDHIDHSSKEFTGTKFGDMMKITCDRGFIAGAPGIVSQSAMCTGNGTWYQPFRRCDPAYCGPPDAQGLLVTGDNYEYGGAPVVFSCLPGFITTMTQAEMTRTCMENGLWSGDPPRCKRRSCPTPQKVEKAKILGTGTVFESYSFYQCKRGYEVVSGTERLYCGADGQWNGTLPECGLVTCYNLDALPGGRIDYPMGKKYGNDAIYRCDAGFKMNTDSGNERRTCTESKAWSGKAPTCERIECSPPADYPNTFRSGSASGGGTGANAVYLYQDEITYACVQGHQIRFSVTTHTKSCTQHGTWDGGDIDCKAIKCPERTAYDGENIIVNVTGFTFGNTITYSCESGFFIKGQKKKVFCQFTGQWDGPVPTCSKVPETPKETVKEVIVPTVAEAPNAQTVGMLGIILMSIELGCMVFLDLITFTRDIKILQRNLAAGCRRWRKNKKQQVTPAEKEPKNDEEVAEMYINDPWAYRSETPSARARDDLATSQTTLSDVDADVSLEGSTADLVPQSHLRPSTATRRLQVLAGFAALPTDGKKKKVIESS